jgi:hypothetical protein
MHLLIHIYNDNITYLIRLLENQMRCCFSQNNGWTKEIKACTKMVMKLMLQNVIKQKCLKIWERNKSKEKKIQEKYRKKGEKEIKKKERKKERKKGSKKEERKEERKIERKKDRKIER